MLTYVNEKFRFIRCDGQPHPSYAYILKFNEKTKKQGERIVNPKLLVVAKCSWVIFGTIIFYVFIFRAILPAYRARFDLNMLHDWPINKSRDTKIYVLPLEITSKHVPKGVCDEPKERHSLFILIVVCSALGNFDKRKTIRDTWGSYENYSSNLEMFIKVRQKYKRPDVKDLYITVGERTTQSMYEILNGKNRPIPVSVKADDNTSRVKGKEQFDKVFKSSYKPGSDSIGKDVNEKANGSENSSSDNDDIEVEIAKIKKVDLLTDDPKSLYKVVFLLGLPDPNDIAIQKKVDEEVNLYGDVIQESVIDSYNNLSIKSVMLLKWAVNKCKDSVRYIFKTDDDIYANVLNLLITLKNISDNFDEKLAGGGEKKEYLLLGYLYPNATPISDIYSKWYSPRYMYSGRLYPPFLSGTGYVMSRPAARALYAAALTTPLFHLEDVFVTGMCAIRSVPVIEPRHSPLFAYHTIYTNDWLCLAYGNITTHRVPVKTMRSLYRRLQVEKNIERCETASLMN